MAPPTENWKRQPWRPRITCRLTTVQWELRAHNLTLNKAVDLAQNQPLWRLMSTYGTMHSYWCMTERKSITELQVTGALWNLAKVWPQPWPRSLNFGLCLGFGLEAKMLVSVSKVWSQWQIYDSLKHSTTKLTTKKLLTNNVPFTTITLKPRFPFFFSGLNALQYIQDI